MMILLALLVSSAFAAPQQSASIHYEDGVNNIGDLRWYGVTSHYPSEDGSITYTCHVDSDLKIDEAITLLVLGNFDPVEIAISTAKINLAYGNKTASVQDWYVSYNVDFASMIKTTTGLTPKYGSENTIPISAEQIKLIIESDSVYIPTKDGTAIRITIPDSFASAARQTWMKCNG